MTLARLHHPGLGPAAGTSRVMPLISVTIAPSVARDNPGLPRTEVTFENAMAN